MQKAAISDLVQNSPHLWRADRGFYNRPVASTGYAALDRALPAGGWPPGVVWLDYPRPGVGELSLAYPAMQALGRQREVVLLNPPFQLYAAALPGKLSESTLIIEPGRFDDALWSADKLARHSACGLILLWTGAGQAVSPGALRRLNLAARQNGSTVMIYNRLCYPVPASMWVAAHCRLQRSGEQLEVTVNKAHGLLRPVSCRIDLN